MEDFATSRVSALEDFKRARRKAALQEVLSQFGGRSTNLLSFEEVRQKLKLQTGRSRGLQDIPLDAIVGSVDRYTDFNRSFLPRQDSDASRWANVATQMSSLQGLPPIEVYQVGQAYFVLDGNHRVSVARRFGASHIQAYVTEFPTKVPLTPDDDVDDLLLKAEYADFLDWSRIDQIRPGVNLEVTVPGRYRELQTRIEAKRYLLGQTEEREVSHQEAVARWYDEDYRPVVQATRERGILRDFPNRTETDLYLWILKHQSELQKELGWSITPQEALADLHTTGGVEEEVWDALLPDELESGPAPGQWRRDREGVRPADHLFASILVPVGGEADSWQAVEQALIVGRREESRLYGLHVVPTQAAREQESAQAVRDRFNQLCRQAQVSGDLSGELSVAVGHVGRTICERSRWVDLVVVRLAHPPGSGPLQKLSSGFRMLLQRCPRPVLAVPGPARPLERAILAYDGGPKAREGLFVATYLAERWHIPLVVLSVIEKEGDPAKLDEARRYLEAHGQTATYLSQPGQVAPLILETARAYDCDLIIMGSYGIKPVFQMVLGSALNEVLQTSQTPMLICR